MSEKNKIKKVSQKKFITREQYQKLSLKDQTQFRKERKALSDKLAKELVSNLNKNVLKESKQEK